MSPNNINRAGGGTFTTWLFGLSVAALICLSCGCPSDPMQVTVRSKPPPDPEMEAATAQARASITNLLAALRSPKPNQTGFGIYARFVDEQKQVEEYLWVSHLVYNAGRFQGTVATTEQTTIGLKLNQPVAVPMKDVIDWVIVEDGKLVGGSAIRLLRMRMSEVERKRFDAGVPYRFE